MQVICQDICHMQVVSPSRKKGNKLCIKCVFEWSSSKVTKDAPRAAIAAQHANTLIVLGMTNWSCCFYFSMQAN